MGTSSTNLNLSACLRLDHVVLHRYALRLRLLPDEVAAALFIPLLASYNLQTHIRHSKQQLCWLPLQLHPGISSSDAAQERTKAHKLFDCVYRVTKQHEETSA